MSSPSSRRRFHVRRRCRPAVVVDIGCGCHRKPKLSSLLSYFSRKSPATNTKKKSGSSYNSADTITTAIITNSAFSPSCNKEDVTSSSSSSASPKPTKKPKRKNKKGALLQVAEESVAVEKDSSDPYLDFKDSMVQMIVEKEMYQWEELRELLNLFLSLNSPYHHPLILRAFNEVWEGLL